MKLTGKDINEAIDEFCGTGRNWMGVMDALAEKLNGMMAGEKEVMPTERTYRHGGESDPQTNSVESPVRASGDDICQNCNHDRDCHTDSSDGRTCSTYTDYEKGEICGCETFVLADRARHHATCPYRHGTGECTC